MNSDSHNPLPIVTVVIPCRNEEKLIASCLDSVIASNYPQDKLEVFVVDGESNDRTRYITEEYTIRFPFIRLLDNPKRHFAAAVNEGISYASGEIVVLMGAHAVYEKGYISQCVRFLGEYDANNVGGSLVPTPLEDTVMAKAITLALAHPFGAGNAYFRIGSKEPRWVDTVFGGCYEKTVFENIGLFNEDLSRSADLEFNMRLRDTGGKILLVPSIVVHYYPKSRLKDFLVHSLSDGFWAVYPLKFGSRPFFLRHLIPLTFVSSLIGSAALSAVTSFFLWFLGGILCAYALANIGSAVHVSLKERSLKYLPALLLAFPARQFPYGVGSLYSLLRVFTSAQFWRHRLESVRTKAVAREETGEWPNGKAPV